MSLRSGTSAGIVDNWLGPSILANASRATNEMDVRIGYLAVFFALVGLAGLVLAQVWVARRFHRRINTGLLAASAALLLALVGSFIGVTPENDLAFWS